MKSIVSTALALLAPVMAAAADQLPLEIKYAPSDTVTAATLNVIAVTEPGASATVNGTDVHVYNTGSFGMPVDLAPGPNTVVVTASSGDRTATRTINIFRKEPGAKAPAAEAPADMLFSQPFTVITKPNAFLVYGNGDDRLGGSKMGFINEGIPLSVTGENGDLYRVQLSSNRYAYIEKGYTEPSPATALPAVNTGTWSITNQGTTDRITVRLPRRLPFRSWTLLEPNTICIELYGAMDNSNWMTQHGPLGIIDYTYFEQPESDVYRIVIRLKDKRCWGYSVGYGPGGALTVDVRHRPRSLALKDLVIGLDAGHGGSSSGAVSPSGLKESDLNLDIVLRLKALLEKQGATVVLTRADDSSLTMTERKRIWKEAGIDLGISVHNNASGSPYTPMGTSVYYKHLFDRPLAECMHRRMLELGVADFGLTGNFNFSLNGPTDYPNVLIEGLFMSNLAEEEMLADPAMRQKMAVKILEGLKDYLKQ